MLEINTKKYLPYIIKVIAYGLIFTAFLMIVGSFFYEEPSYIVESYGYSQKFIKGNEFTYELSLSKKNYGFLGLDNSTENDNSSTIKYNVTYVYIGSDCFDLYAFSSYVGRTCKSNLSIVFPFLHVYPKKSEKAEVYFYMKTKDFKSLLFSINYTKTKEFEYKGRDAIEILSTEGERIIVDKNTGVILNYQGPTFNATLIK